MKIAKQMLAGVVVLCLFTACSKEGEMDFASDGTGTMIKVVGKTLSTKSSMAKLNYKEATACFEDIYFTRTDDNGNVLAIPYSGSYRVDLLNGSTKPEMPMAELIFGRYTSFNATIRPINGNPASFQMTAEYENEAGEIFEVVFSSGATIPIERNSTNGFYIQNGDLYTFMLTIIFPSIFVDINLDLATVTDGKIVIDDTHNTLIAKEMEQNIQAAVQYSFLIDQANIPF